MTKIVFINNDLEKYANKDRYGYRKLGLKRFKKFKQRLDQLKASETLEDLRNQPGRFHELKNDRKGQWACDLDHPYRLIFRPQENPVPNDENGNYIWSKIKSTEIIEIKNYH